MNLWHLLRAAEVAWFYSARWPEIGPPYTVDRWQHESRANATRRADGAEQVGPGVALVARCARTAAAVGPDVGQAALLADPGFVLPPQLDRLAASRLGDRGGDQGGKVFPDSAETSASLSRR